jgi:hypothetical protein
VLFGFHISFPTPLQVRHPDRAVPHHGSLPRIFLRCTDSTGSEVRGHALKCPRLDIQPREPGPSVIALFNRPCAA